MLGTRHPISHEIGYGGVAPNAGNDFCREIPND